MTTPNQKTQKALDFSVRGHRLAVLDRLQLPEASGTSRAAMLAVLRNLESHIRVQDECRVKAERISQEINASVPTVRRALRGLRDLYLVDVQRTGRSSAYRIIWSNVEALLEEQTAAAIDHGDLSDRSGRSNRVIRVIPLIDQDDPSTEASKESPIQPPPPSEWTEAEAAVGKVLARWRPAIASARQAGVAPSYVLDCVAFYHAAGGALGPGALHDRLHQAAPFLSPEDPATWPPPRAMTARERQAHQLLDKVRTWCQAEGLEEDQVRETFTRAATSEKHGPYTPEEIQRVLYETKQVVRSER